MYHEYELFIYVGEMNRLNGIYSWVAHSCGIPSVGQNVGRGYKVIAVYKEFDIIDVVIE